MGRTVNGKRGPGVGGRGPGVVFAALALLAAAAPSAMATTRISGRLYSAVSPLRPNTKCTIAWPSFTSGERQILAGSTDLTVTAGLVDVRLEPTDTAVPVFTYELLCRTAGVVVAREYWGVETTDSVLTPAQVWRATSQVAKGDKGDTGDQGEKGNTGDQGLKGDKGDSGDNGDTVLNGSSVPSNGTGSDGDFYIRTTTNCLYGPKASGSWPSPCVSLGGLATYLVAVSGTTTTVTAAEHGLGARPTVASCIDTDGVSYLPGPASLTVDGDITISSVAALTGQCKLVGSITGVGQYAAAMSGTSVTILAATHQLAAPSVLACYDSSRVQYEPGGWSRNAGGDVTIASTETMSGYCILQ